MPKCFNMITANAVAATLMACFVLFSPSASAEISIVQTESRIALVFGNATYLEQADIPAAAQDAQAIADRFQALGIEVFGGAPKTNLSRAEMLREIEAFIDVLGLYDSAIVYFAGHGLSNGAESYLIPIEGVDAPDDEWLPRLAVTLSRDLIEPLHAACIRTVIILDTSARADLPSRSVDCSNSNTSGPHRNNNKSLGLTAIGNTSPGMAIMMADGFGDTAYEAPNNEGGYFTSGILAALSDQNTDLFSVFSAARLHVQDAGVQRQSPWMISNLSEPFHFDGTVEAGQLGTLTAR